ncbi:MAG: enoyl-CoA hydratase/isomerase family protein [Bacteroidia bacterium]|nr:enoyl-CoA hydratase/isomerase family protein [Bacteroidia bacterium]
MSDPFVKTEIQDGIGIITFFHPQSNSMPGEQLRKLAEEITNAGKNDEIKVIVLKSEGDKAFCAGASFDELVQIENEEQGLKFFSGFAHVINSMRKAPKFILARVHSKAVGGGVGIASAADYTFAVPSASVKLSELAVGIGPFVVGPAVERKIGKAAFQELATDASNWRSAQWANEKGLYTDLYDSISDMDKALMALAGTLAKSSPQAMAELKKVYWEGTEQWDDLLIQRAKISGRLILSEFSKNFIRKFKNK